VTPAIHELHARSNDRHVGQTLVRLAGLAQAVHRGEQARPGSSTAGRSAARSAPALASLSGRVRQVRREVAGLVAGAVGEGAPAE